MKLFELYAELGLNSKGFDTGVQQASQAGKKLQSNLSAISAKTVALGHLLYDAGKASIKAAADFTKSIVREYSETEQLIGGVQTIFKDSAADVIANAERAYKTAGLSANDYMQTVTSFSASLLQSLKGNTSEATKYADMAVQDMADNANKFGTNIGMIQNAYQGFAKQNYTMLDNLKLGYGGTQAEMQRLLKDAAKIQRANGINVRYNMKNLDDIIEAIHVIQDSMGVTGTTATEAADTIAGSFNSFKASWENILAGIGNDEADIDKLFDALVESGKNLVKNIVKVAPTIGKNFKAAFQKVADAAAAAIPDIKAAFVNAWNNTLPQVFTDGANACIDAANAAFGTNIPHISQISFPTWEEIEASFSEWWASTKTSIETGATWVLGIFTNPTQTADEIKAAISGWWEGTARPVIEGACQWVLSFPNMPDETKEETEAIVHEWWGQTGTWISNACSWTLQMFNVPTETAEEVAALIADWWEGIYDTVKGICKVGFSLVSGNAEDAVQAIKDWWAEVKDTVAESISIGFTLRFPNIPAIVQSIKDWWAEVTGAKDATANVEAELTLPDAAASTQSVNNWWGSVKAGTSTDVDVNPSLPQSSTVVDFITKWWATVTESLNLSLPIPSGAGVNENGMGGAGRRFSGPGFATGLDYVPYNNFAARLHKGEAVLTAREAADWRMGKTEQAPTATADLSVVERLLSQLVAAAERPVPAIIDEESVYSYVSQRQARDVAVKRYI